MSIMTTPTNLKPCGQGKETLDTLQTKEKEFKYVQNQLIIVQDAIKKNSFLDVAPTEIAFGKT